MRVIDNPTQRVLVTVGLEDYFHVGAFENLIVPGHWSRFERRIERNTRATLELFDSLNVQATFFVLGWVAEHLPEVIAMVVSRGHEVATQGYGHHRIGQLPPAAFQDDLLRSKATLEAAAGRKVLGHRVPHFLGPSDLWALETIAQAGYAYDSSIRPALWQFGSQPWRRLIHGWHRGGRSLFEVPVSSVRAGGLSWPIAGGGAFRQLPEVVVNGAVNRWFERETEPFVLYFHAWELDPDQPRITASRMQQIRQYRNLDRMPQILANQLRGRECVSIAAHLGLAQDEITAAPKPTPAVVPTTTATSRLPVTIVIPCYNETASLTYLANTLESVRETLAPHYAVRLIFVDDGSTDDTLQQLHQIFGSLAHTTVLSHGVNRGVGEAIMTGIRAAQTEIVCSIDADCTYDPHELLHMIPRLTDSVDLVTGSPYHPDGEVVHVPTWRLGLSKGASQLYRTVLGARLHTYTSCFRVYRRSSVAEIVLTEEGFLGVAELLALLLLRGAHVVEHPAVLRVRVLGHSKMKTAKAIAGHLRLLRRLWLARPEVGTLPLPMTEQDVHQQPGQS